MQTSMGPKGSCALIPFGFSDAHFREESAFSEVHSQHSSGPTGHRYPKEADLKLELS